MSEMELTLDEIKIIRKALQYTLNAHLSVEVFEGREYKDTKIDELLRRFREAEEKEDSG